MRRKPVIPMMRLKSSFDLKKLIYGNTPYGLCSFAEVIGGPSDFDILKRPKENDRISTGTTDTATSK